jgi:hypothetical protein
MEQGHLAGFSYITTVAIYHFFKMDFSPVREFLFGVELFLRRFQIQKK